jgi:outer membrane biosynthesis protein TonB
LARNDEGEFELVLGNRQLISVFLIVVILLGVFFSMGYIVGRNSSPTGGIEVAKNGGAKAASEPPADSPPASSPAPATQASAPPPETKATAPERVTTHAEQPAVEVPPPPKPTPVNPAPVNPAKEKKSPVPPPPARSERAPVTGEPPAGDYWQVVATARPDAEIVAEALTKKGLRAIVAPAPREGIFRVLVGPLSDSATQAQTRTQLEAAGFKNPIVRKY